MFDALPEEWRRITLGEVIRLEYGRSLPETSRLDGDVPVYGSNGPVGFHSEHLVAERGIVVGRKGTAGSVNVTEGAFWPIDTTYYVRARQNVDFGWLEASLRHADLGALNEATGVPGLNRDNAYRQAVLLPPFAEQQRIGEVLRSVDAARAANECASVGAQKTLRAYQMQAFKHAADQDAGRPLESLLDRIIDYRGVPPPKADSGVPLLTAKNVRLGYLDPEPREFIAENDYDAWMRRGIPSCGDILFTTEAPLGFVAEFPAYKAALGQRTITLVAKPDQITRPYLKWLLLSPPVQDLVHRHATGSTAKGIKQSTFRKLRVNPPPISEQREIAATCESLWNVLTETRRAVARLTILKEQLSDDLLSSRVRVPA
jgi:type I restriction enzyme S subunit